MGVVITECMMTTINESKKIYFVHVNYLGRQRANILLGPKCDAYNMKT